MHISRVQVENFKRLRGVDIEVDGNVVTIGGKNAQGKSSLIDAIWNAIGGKQKAVTEPIRQGERQASATITLQEDHGGAGLVVRRTWKGETSKLTVTPLGSKAALGQPQNVLNELVGRFAFDPLEFANSSPKVQRDILADLVGVDLSALDERRKAVYDGRTATNRDVKRFAATLEEMGEPPAVGDVPDLQALLVERDAFASQETHLKALRRRYELHGQTISELEAEAIRIQGKIAELQKDRTEIGREGIQAEAALKAMRSPEDIGADIDAATQQGDARRAADRYADIKERLAEAETESEEATEELARIDAEKAEKLAAAQLPVPGLSFDEEQVLLFGVPFTQASAAERIRTSVAIAVAQNPKLRVICVKDATLMDEDNLALLRSLAAEHNFQLFLELVGSSGNETVVIEDGGVA